MSNDNDLKGTIIMIHPQLWEELKEPQALIGEIIAADTTNDDIYVDYGGKQAQLHSADAILVLKSSDEIYEQLKNNAGNLSSADFKDLKSIALLLDYGTPKHNRKAMELLQNNPNIHFTGAIALEDHLALQQNKGLKR